MGVRYLKKIDGLTDLVVVKEKPVYGKIPTWYRGVDINLNGHWYRSVGNDIYDASDPFGDGSLLRKYNLDGDLLDTVTGTPAQAYDASGLRGTNNEDSPGTPIEAKFGRGIMGRKCLLPTTDKAGGGYINCGELDRSKKEEITLSIRIFIPSNYDPNIPGSNLCSLWCISNDRVSDSVNARQPIAYYDIMHNRFETHNNTQYTGEYFRTEVELDKSLIGTWVHYVNVITVSTFKTYINGKLVNITNTKDRLSFDNGELWIRDKFNNNNTILQQFEVYGRALTDDEVQVIYNQKHKDIKPCDGVGNNPDNFAYIEDNEGLIELIVADKTGELLSKKNTRGIGEIKSTDNIVMLVDDKLVDRYGNSARLAVYGSGYLETFFTVSRDTSYNNNIFIPIKKLYSNSVMFDESNNSIIIEEDGVYNINFNDSVLYNVPIPVSSSTYTIEISLYINSYPKECYSSYISGLCDDTIAQIIFNGVLSLKRGDVCQMRIKVSSSADGALTLFGDDKSSFSIYKIGDSNE